MASYFHILSLSCFICHSFIRRYVVWVTAKALLKKQQNNPL